MRRRPQPYCAHRCRSQRYVARAPVPSTQRTARPTVILEASQTCEPVQPSLGNFWPGAYAQKRCPWRGDRGFGDNSTPTLWRCEFSPSHSTACLHYKTTMKLLAPAQNSSTALCPAPRLLPSQTSHENEARFEVLDKLLVFFVIRNIPYAIAPMDPELSCQVFVS